MVHRLAVCAVAVTLSAAAGNTPANAQMHKMSGMEQKKMEGRLADWPKASREAAMYMANKYGSPASMSGDNTIPSLDNLLDPVRGSTAPHPFYLSDASRRADVIEYLRGLDTRSEDRR